MAFKNLSKNYCLCHFTLFLIIIYNVLAFCLRMSGQSDYSTKWDPPGDDVLVSLLLLSHIHTHYMFILNHFMFCRWLWMSGMWKAYGHCWKTRYRRSRKRTILVSVLRNCIGTPTLWFYISTAKGFILVLKRLLLSI